MSEPVLAGRRRAWLVGGAMAVVAVALAVLRPGPLGPGRATPLAADADPAAAVERLGGCPMKEPSNFDPYPPEFIIANVDRWLEVTGVTLPDGEGPVRESLGPIALDVLARDPLGPAAATPRRIRVGADRVEALDWAMRSGARAYVAITSDLVDSRHRPHPELVTYVLLRHRSGAHFFGGWCARVALTDPLRDMLGGSYEAAMSAIVGLPGAEVATVVAMARAELRSVPRVR